MKKILITGGAGFIGSNFITSFLSNKHFKIHNIDLLTYAGNYSTIERFESNDRYSFSKGDIGNKEFIESEVHRFKPDYIVNFAAESHVDRSISSPFPFIHSNIVGTFNLLESALSYLRDSKKINLKILSSYMFQQMRYMARSVMTSFSQSYQDTILHPHILHRKLLQIIWFEHGIGLSIFQQ